MKTTVLKADPQTQNDAVKEALRRAGQVLRQGGLVAFPTETVYGLGADAFNKDAAAKIYAAKGRPRDNPLIVHIADICDLDRLLRDPESEEAHVARKLAKVFWPGPLTMVLHKTEDLPAQTTGGLSTVAVRLPANEIARTLIREGGGFVAAPSANVSGRPSPTSAAHCITDLDGRVDVIIDGGDCDIGLESTIVDLTGREPEILRPGKITKEAVFEALALRKTYHETKKPSGTEEDAAPRAPGMKYRHYAPRGVLSVVRGDTVRVQKTIEEMLDRAHGEGKRTGVISANEHAKLYRADVVLSRGKEGDEEALAHNLYRVLRGMDEQNAEEIFFELSEREGYTDAVQNRLYKACGGRLTEV